MGKLCKAAALYANEQHIDVPKRCVCAQYGCGKQFEIAVTLNHDVMTILTPQVTKNPKFWAKYGGYNCVKLLPYAYGQHINVLKHCVYV